MDVVELTDLAIHPEEEEPFRVPGARHGCPGFSSWGMSSAASTPTPPRMCSKGSGLSSSAAFEVLLGNILSHLSSTAAGWRL